MENNDDKKRVYALVLSNLLEVGSEEFNKLYNTSWDFKSEIDFLKLRLNLILDEKERAEYDEIHYKGCNPGKFIVNLYDGYWVSYDDGFWNWDNKARESVYEVYDDLSKISIQVGHGFKEYEIKSKKLRK